MTFTQKILKTQYDPYKIHIIQSMCQHSTKNTVGYKWKFHAASILHYTCNGIN
jgi:hypothetical protein